MCITQYVRFTLNIAYIYVFLHNLFFHVMHVTNTLMRNSKNIVIGMMPLLIRRRISTFLSDRYDE